MRHLRTMRDNNKYIKIIKFWRAPFNSLRTRFTTDKNKIQYIFQHILWRFDFSTDPHTGK